MDNIYIVAKAPEVETTLEKIAKRKAGGKNDKHPGKPSEARSNNFEGRLPDSKQPYPKHGTGSQAPSAPKPYPEKVEPKETPKAPEQKAKAKFKLGMKSKVALGTAGALALGGSAYAAYKHNQSKEDKAA